MLKTLFLVPTLPFASSLVLGLLGRKLSPRASAWIGVGAIGITVLLAILVSASFVLTPPEDHLYIQNLWTWMSIGSFRPSIALTLDPLSVVMMLVVSFVAFLIHVYSVEFMLGEEGYSRFFAYMNLFVASMLTLVLGSNLLLLYLGWEGVGLCSYLLIGFWYKDPANGRAARKAFVVTRIGDSAMAIGLFILFLNLGTLEIQPLLREAAARWSVGSPLAIAAAALLLGGAVGKSAQLPLQTWLPDAMAGPTPVSALIHAATMVTAGVYLIARTHTLFELAPPVQLAVAIIGAATLLISAFSALTQRDIKRILAYSTISQIGYMFLALGVSAWSAGIFHLMTHACFKALLFLAAGGVILSVHHEHDIFRMGGLRREIPVVFWTFVIGAASLAAFPLVTAGFYSKDLILNEVFVFPHGGHWLWLCGSVATFITALYSFRLIFIVFFGPCKTEVGHKPGPLVGIPLMILGILSIFAGLINLPSFLAPAFEPFGGPRAVLEAPGWVPIAASIASLAGIFSAYIFYYKQPTLPARAAARMRAVHALLFSGWGFDWLYDRIWIRPFLFLARVNREDAIDLFFDAVGSVSLALNRGLSRLQSGRTRWYAAAIGTGAVVLIALVEVL